MKATLWILALLVGATLIWGACSDDFLITEDKENYIMTDTLDLVGHVADYTIQINIPQAKNSAYTVMVYPKWIELEYFEGCFEDGYAYITLSTANEDLFPSQEYIGNLVLDIGDFGYLQLVSRYRRE
jgi:hypothetical protein